jgi:hypothetical protein
MAHSSITFMSWVQLSAILTGFFCGYSLCLWQILGWYLKLHHDYIVPHSHQFPFLLLDMLFEILTEPLNEPLINKLIDRLNVIECYFKLERSDVIQTSRGMYKIVVLFVLCVCVKVVFHSWG